MMGDRWGQDVHRFELWLGFIKGVGKANVAVVCICSNLQITDNQQLMYGQSLSQGLIIIINIHHINK